MTVLKGLDGMEELKAGESVFQTLSWQKWCLVNLEEDNHCFMHFLAPKHLSGALWAPAINASD